MSTMWAPALPQGVVGRWFRSLGCSVPYSCTFLSGRRNLASVFRTHILGAKDGESVSALSPVRLLGSCSFLYLQHKDVYILGVTKSNANAMLAFQFMTNVGTLLSFIHASVDVPGPVEGQ